MAKYLDSTGLTYLWSKIKNYVSSYVSLSNGTITIGSNDITPITSHQDISGKADKSEMAVSTSGDTTTITLKTGTSATVINAHQSISGKADKATTLAGYGITDAKIASGTITLGSDTITPLTSHQDISGKVDTSSVGAANGVCPLNSSTKIDSTYLPSYVDDVIEAYARTGQTALSSTWLATGSASGTVITPETGKIYILMADTTDYDANTQFRWGGSAYVKLNDGGVSAITNAEIDVITAN